LLAVAFRVQAFMTTTFCLLVNVNRQTTSLLWSRPSPVKRSHFGSLLGSALDQAALPTSWLASGTLQGWRFCRPDGAKSWFH